MLCAAARRFAIYPHLHKPIRLALSGMLRRLPRLHCRLASRRRPRFMRGHCRTALVGESLTPTTRATSVIKSLVALWRRFAALEPSGAAGWAAKVLHGTPGMAKRHSVRMSRHEVWPEGQTRASESPLTRRTDERAMKGRDPKTPSRPSPCKAIRRPTTMPT